MAIKTLLELNRAGAVIEKVVGKIVAGKYNLLHITFNGSKEEALCTSAAYADLKSAVASIRDGKFFVDVAPQTEVVTFE